MNISDTNCRNWNDVLIENGFNYSITKSFIGFISWNRGEEFTKIGRQITEILSGYKGELFVKDVVSSTYNDKGLMFFNSEIPEEISNNMFDTIMNYEQNNIYGELH
ncbi:hypothetical protein SH2C18_49870 [Clostridium sediminicola]|uniref:hypothetical protein n=1 Tax=Clostridium sediminicola TaxID=3114879 RepID=UPI0031F1D11C